MSNNERIIYKGTKDHELYSNPNNFHGFTSEPTVLPPVWDGKFQKTEQPEMPPLQPGERLMYKGTKEHELYSNANNFHGFTSEPEILPPVWDGKFQKAEQPDLPPLQPGERYVTKGTKDHELLSDGSKYHGYHAEPTKLPVAWDGTFAKSDEVFIKPNRNASNPDNFFERKSYTTILPTAWDGTFAKSGETYMKPERNNSDSREYH